MEEITKEVVQNTVYLTMGILVIDIAVMIVQKIVHYMAHVFEKVNIQDLNFRLGGIKK